MPSYVLLADRGVVELAGEDVVQFLQGLVSSDVNRLAETRAIYAALLTAQGKYLHDFFIIKIGEAIYLDCEAARAADLKRRLGFYRLRDKIAIEDASDRFEVAALMGADALEPASLSLEPGAAAPLAGGIAFTDPRLSALGARALLPAGTAAATLEEQGFAAAERADYDRLRLGLGVPDGSRDLDVEKAFALEGNLEELHGVDFDKGCYIGQEVTARMKHRATVRKRLIPVAIDGPRPEPGTPVMLGASHAGEMRSSMGVAGLALLRMDHLERAAQGGGTLLAGEARLTPHRPDWAAY